MKIASFCFTGILVLICFTSCNSPQENIETLAEAVQETPSQFDTTLVDPIDTIQEALTPQEVLDNFLMDFGQKTTLPSICYENFYEYEATRRHYFYDGEKLAALFEDFAVEGGEGGQLRILLTRFPDGSTHETILYMPYLTDETGYFSYVDGELPKFFEVAGNFDQPKITGAADERFYEYETDLFHYRNLITENKSRFIATEAGYHWDLKRETVNSEYGEIMIFEFIRVKNSIFETHF